MKKEYSYAVDLWSLGVTMYEFLYRQVSSDSVLVVPFVRFLRPP